jgi:hypothetical protein
MRKKNDGFRNDDDNRAEMTMNRRSDKTEAKTNSSNFLAVFTGANDISENSLLDKKLIISNFPVTFGREMPKDFPFSDRHFIQINDQRPYCISPKQFSLVINRGQVYVEDENSKLGTIVDGEPLGESLHGKKAIPIRPGKHVIQLGGVSSPLVFFLEIKEP